MDSFWPLIKLREVAYTSAVHTVLSATLARTAAKNYAWVFPCTLFKIVSVSIASRVTKFEDKISCVVLPKLTDALPQKPVSRMNIQISHDITVSDDGFDKSADIDIIIGASLFCNLLSSGQINYYKNQPIQQDAVLGWIVSGPIKCSTNFAQLKYSCNLALKHELNQSIKKFQEVEHRLFVDYFTEEE